MQPNFLIRKDSANVVQHLDILKWLIMFIAILSVKLKVKTYLQIHKIALKYWDIIAEGLDLKPISERRLRDRFKKIRHQPGKPAAFIFQLFPGLGK
jgi:hypothetical protein